MTPDEIYSRYGEKMYHYLALRLGSLEDAEDILQETFCRLARYSLRWRLIRYPQAFVFKALKNEADRHLRRLIRERDSSRPNPGPEQDLNSFLEGPDEQMVKLVSQGLSQLPDEQREVIILKVYQDFSFKEIAAVCRLSINTAASRYRYGIEKLRSFLEARR